jgi:hypothetical protein
VSIRLYDLLSLWVPVNIAIAQTKVLDKLQVERLEFWSRVDTFFTRKDTGRVDLSAIPTCASHVDNVKLECFIGKKGDQKSPNGESPFIWFFSVTVRCGRLDLNSAFWTVCVFLHLKSQVMVMVISDLYCLYNITIEFYV